MKKCPGLLPVFVILKTDVMTNLRNTIITGDCLAALKILDYQLVDLVITSPPYFQQRNYGNNGLIAERAEIGNETTEEAYLKNLIAVFRACIRVTKPTGAIRVSF